MLALAGACGDSDPGEPDARPDESPIGSAAESSGSPSSEPVAADAAAQVLGEQSTFRSGGQGTGPLDVQVNGRECVLTDALFGSCRASSGTGGAFVVTAESTPDAPSDWTVVVRCGLSPALPGASAKGSFQPMTADLGLEPYGEVVGVTLRGDVAEGALVYQPQGSDCPVVWSLGEIGRTSLFTGGTDALNGETDPIWFVDGQGREACAVADGQAGIKVGIRQGDGCT
jgi:hypothetical protein